MRKVSDVAAFGVGALVGVIALLVLSFVLSAGCDPQSGRSYPDTFRIDGSCFVVFTREARISAVRYPCPVAHEELVKQEGGVL